MAFHVLEREVLPKPCLVQYTRKNLIVAKGTASTDGTAEGTGAISGLKLSSREGRYDQVVEEEEEGVVRRSDRLKSGRVHWDTTKQGVLIGSFVPNYTIVCSSNEICLRPFKLIYKRHQRSPRFRKVRWGRKSRRSPSKRILNLALLTSDIDEDTGIARTTSAESFSDVSTIEHESCYEFRLKKQLIEEEMTSNVRTCGLNSNRSLTQLLKDGNLSEDLIGEDELDLNSIPSIPQSNHYLTGPIYNDLRLGQPVQQEVFYEYRQQASDNIRGVRLQECGIVERGENAEFSQAARMPFYGDGLNILTDQVVENYCRRYTNSYCTDLNRPNPTPYGSYSSDGRELHGNHERPSAYNGASLSSCVIEQGPLAPVTPEKTSQKCILNRKGGKTISETDAQSCTVMLEGPDQASKSPKKTSLRQDMGIEDELFDLNKLPEKVEKAKRKKHRPKVFKEKPQKKPASKPAKVDGKATRRKRKTKADGELNVKAQEICAEDGGNEMNNAIYNESSSNKNLDYSFEKHTTSHPNISAGYAYLPMSYRTSEAQRVFPEHYQQVYHRSVGGYPSNMDASPANTIIPEPDKTSLQSLGMLTKNQQNGKVRQKVSRKKVLVTELYNKQGEDFVDNVSGAPSAPKRKRKTKDATSLKGDTKPVGAKRRKRASITGDVSTLQQVSVCGLNSLSELESMMEHITRCMEQMNLQDCNQLVEYKAPISDIVPYSMPKKKIRPKVMLDQESNNMWKQLSTGTYTGGCSEFWEKERREMKVKVEQFISLMHLVQGDRRFSKWKGSVVDSVVGAFLTQNVSDHLSSSAFMAMASNFPLAQKNNKEEDACEGAASEASDCKKSVSSPTTQEGSICFQQAKIPTESESVCGYDSLDSLHSEPCIPPARMLNSIISEEASGTANTSIVMERYYETSDSGSGQQKADICLVSSTITNIEESGTTSVTARMQDPECPSTPRERESLYEGPDCHPSTPKEIQSFYEGPDYFEKHRKRYRVLEELEATPARLCQEPVRDFQDDLDIPFEPAREQTRPRVQRQLFAEGSRYSKDEENSVACLDANCNPPRMEDNSALMLEKLEHETEISISASENFIYASDRGSVTTIQERSDSIQGRGELSSSQPENTCRDNISVQESGIIHVLDVESQNISDQEALQDDYNPCGEAVSDGKVLVNVKLCSGCDASPASGSSTCSTSREVLTSENLTGVPVLPVDKQEKIDLRSLAGLKRAKLEESRSASRGSCNWEAMRQKIIEAETEESGVNSPPDHLENTIPDDSFVQDSVDWETVRCSQVADIAQVIKERGMNNILAGRIKAFLDRVHSEHGKIDLEWLRKLPVEDAKNFLLSVRGLGLKSVECIRLLTLRHLAFPVDTNVGRICVRLGWVPIEPLPEELKLHLLELYPVQATIQKWLWPRICTLDQKTLYELHYQMITFGKVFCTKSRPNCNACPLRADCKHFASAYASANFTLPAPEQAESSERLSLTAAAVEQKDFSNLSERLALPAALEEKENADSSHPVETSYGRDSHACNNEPIIEEPTTPEPFYVEDIEDIAIHHGYEVWEEDSIDLRQSIVESSDCNQGIGSTASNQSPHVVIHDLDSKALVALPPEAAYIPVPKLKNIGRLRTIHYVYELPDEHPLLKEMDAREVDDPCYYLLAIWGPGETPDAPLGLDGCNENSRHEEGAGGETVRGTLLIPCRTAMRGSFPLNGTYFQVNEVFADHQTSLQPIEVPRSLLWNLRRRFVYFGTSVTSIFRGFRTEEIQACFWKGYVCVRGFERSRRAPRPLAPRLHLTASKRPIIRKRPVVIKRRAVSKKKGEERVDSGI